MIVSSSSKVDTSYIWKSKLKVNHLMMTNNFFEYDTVEVSILSSVIAEGTYL